MLKKKNIVKVENYFEVFLVCILFFLFFYLISTFLMAIFLAATIVFLVYKPYLKLVERTNNKPVSALFVMFLVFCLVLLPTFIIGVSLVKETSSLIYHGGQIVSNINLDSCASEVCLTLKNNMAVFDEQIESFVKNIGQYIAASFTNIFTSVSKMFINFFVFLLAFYFLLVDGDKFMRYLKRIIPMKTEYKHALFLRFRDVSKTVLIDSIFIAIVQGSLVGIGFYFAGISSPIFWGTVAAFFALIPIVGTTIVWIPAALFLFFSGSIWTAVIFAFYCMLIVGLSDNVLRAALLTKKMKIHPFLVLISVLGGLEIFGFFGIFIGPIIISLLITVVQLYKLDLNEW